MARSSPSSTTACSRRATSPRTRRSPPFAPPPAARAPSCSPARWSPPPASPARCARARSTSRGSRSSISGRGSPTPRQPASGRSRSPPASSSRSLAARRGSSPTFSPTSAVRSSTSGGARERRSRTEREPVTALASAMNAGGKKERGGDVTARYVIGIDGGTEGLRAAVVDLEGTVLAMAASPYETRFPHPAWAEQDPADWWRALGIAVRGAVAQAGVKAGDVAAIGLDSTCCSVVALDAGGEALRPALIWMDVRSAEQAARVAASGDPSLKVNGGGRGPVSAEWMIPKALWLKEREPALFERAATVCEFQDYINHRLTGRMVASINNASVRWHYDARGSGYAASLVRRVGAEALLEKWPREVVPLGAVIGGLTARAAEHLGLAKGLPVAQGGADAFIAMIGLGVVRPGRLALITGSSHLQLGVSDKPLHAKGIWGTYPDAVIPDLYIVEGGQTSTGSIVNWLKHLLPDSISYDKLNAQAKAL